MCPYLVQACEQDVSIAKAEPLLEAQKLAACFQDVCQHRIFGRTFSGMQMQLVLTQQRRLNLTAECIASFTRFNWKVSTTQLLKQLNWVFKFWKQ